MCYFSVSEIIEFMFDSVLIYALTNSLIMQGVGRWVAGQTGKQRDRQVVRQADKQVV